MGAPAGGKATSWRGRAREAVARAVRYSGAPRLVRSATARGYAAILLYHDPAPALFEQHLAYLAARFRFVALDDVVDAVRSRDWSRIPPRAVAITLDDGHARNHALLSLFRRFEVRPTIYLCSRIVGTARHFWFHEAVPVSALKRARNDERLAALKRATGFEPEREYPGPLQALSAEQIREMAPHVDFGAHTRSHPILPQCSDAEAWDEIEGSRRDLEAMLGRPVRHFAYPNGDYLDREAGLAERAGFASARTIDLGWTHAGSDPYRLRILGVTDDASVDMLAVQLSGLPTYLRRVVEQRRLDGRWTPNPVAAGGPARGEGA